MKKKINLVSTIFSLLFFVLGIVLLILGFAVEKGYKSLAITGTVLMVLSLVLSALIYFVQKETTGSEAKMNEEATAICPHCGKKNPGNIPYCTHCGCRLK